MKRLDPATPAGARAELELGRVLAGVRLRLGRTPATDAQPAKGKSA